MQICTHCVLPETFPRVELNDQGVCRYCRSFKGPGPQQELREEYRRKFERLLSDHPGPGDYDILMAFSGGKDSTYTLDILRRRYGLRLLALTFDHGFVSPRALENMRQVVERLEVDHLLFRPRFDLCRRMFLASMEEIYPRKSLERASTICTSCMSLVKFTMLKVALEKRIPFIGYGWSPGQAPIQSAVLKTSPSLIQITQKVIFEPLCQRLGDEIRPYFLGPEQFSDPAFFPYLVHPLAFLPYHPDEIFRRIEELGWRRPDDTDPHSTNCLMNGFACRQHRETYGFHPYAWEISGLVRMGLLSREEGLRKLAGSENEEVVREVRKKLGLNASGSAARPLP